MNPLDTDTVQRLRVVLGSIVTWMVALSTVITMTAPSLPADWQTVAATVVAWLGSAVLIIRRVSPARESAVGILPVVHRDGP